MNLDLTKDIFIRTSRRRYFNSLHITNVGIHNFNYIKGIKNKNTQNFYTMHYILSGRGELNLGKKTYFLSKNQLFFVPPNVEYAYFPDELQPWKYLWLSFVGDEAEINNLLSDMGISIDNPTVTPRSYKEMLHALYLLDLSDYLEDRVFSLTATSVFFKILSLIELEHRKKEENSICLITEKAANYLIDNYAKSDLSISEVANHIKLSHAYICRTFKKNKGLSMKQFLTEYRLKRACELLEYAQLTVKDVAFECGFFDEIQFSKTFKKHLGISPGKYRAKTL